MELYEAGMSGAQARATAQQVTMVIDEVRKIAHHTMGDLTDQAGTHKSKFGDAAKVHPGAFGHVPKAQQFATHQEAARQVFVDTYQGVIKDLEDFRTNLLACADAHQANDESVEAGLLALSSSLGSHTLAAARDNRASREKHGSELGDAGDGPRDASTTAATGNGTDEARTDTQTTTAAGGAGHADAPTPHSFS